MLPNRPQMTCQDQKGQPCAYHVGLDLWSHLCQGQAPCWSKYTHLYHNTHTSGNGRSIPKHNACPSTFVLLFPQLLHFSHKLCWRPIVNLHDVNDTIVTCLEQCASSFTSLHTCLWVIKMFFCQIMSWQQRNSWKRLLWHAMGFTCRLYLVKYLR